MKTPQEIEVWYVLPAIRRECAKEMRSKGLKQKEIAVLLDVTEAAISQYMHAKRANELIFPEDVKNAVTQAIERIIRDKKVLLEETFRICELIKKDETLCKIHRKYDSDIPTDCDICFKA